MMTWEACLRRAWSLALAASRSVGKKGNDHCFLEVEVEVGKDRIFLKHVEDSLEVSRVP